MTTIAISLERCTLITMHERAPHTVPQADRRPVTDTGWSTVVDRPCPVNLS